MPSTSNLPKSLYYRKDLILLKELHIDQSKMDLTFRAKNDAAKYISISVIPENDAALTNFKLTIPIIPQNDPVYYNSLTDTASCDYEYEYPSDGTDELSNNSTAEIAANSPRYRRRSSTFIDAVHDIPDENASPMAPAQLYSTMSGRLFHSGRIAIVLVGPPARGKT
jgi:hypothetical protein